MGGPVRVWTRRAVGAILAAFVVNAALSGLGVRHDAVLITLLAVATTAAGVLALSSLDSTSKVVWRSAPPERLGDRGEDTRTATYRHVVESHLTSRQTDETVRWQLADLASRRLRQVHGLRYADDPARVRELLGEQLAGWVAVDRRDRYRPDHRGRRHTVAELGDVVRRIEEL